MREAGKEAEKEAGREGSRQAGRCAVSQVGGLEREDGQDSMQADKAEWQNAMCQLVAQHKSRPTFHTAAPARCVSHGPPIPILPTPLGRTLCCRVLPDARATSTASSTLARPSACGRSSTLPSTLRGASPCVCGAGACRRASACGNWFVGAPAACTNAGTGSSAGLTWCWMGCQAGVTHTVGVHVWEGCWPAWKHGCVLTGAQTAAALRMH